MKKEPDFINHIEPYLSDLVTFSAIEEYDNWAGLIKQSDLPEGMNLRPDTKEINKSLALVSLTFGPHLMDIYDSVAVALIKQLSMNWLSVESIKNLLRTYGSVIEPSRFETAFLMEITPRSAKNVLSTDLLEKKGFT